MVSSSPNALHFKEVDEACQTPIARDLHPSHPLSAFGRPATLLAVSCAYAPWRVSIGHMGGLVEGLFWVFIGGPILIVLICSVVPVAIGILGAVLAAISAPFTAISALFDERREKGTEEHRRDKAMEEAHRAVGDSDQVLLPRQVWRLQAEEKQRQFEAEQLQFAARVAERAEEARQVRSEVTELLKMGALTVSRLLERADDNEILGRMKVMAVVESLTAGDKAEAREAMIKFAIGPDRRLRGLGETQRENLISRFG